MMDAKFASETSGYVRTTQRYNLEGPTLHSQRRENFSSNMKEIISGILGLVLDRGNRAASSSDKFTARERTS
jgi:hypothetical protein